MRKLIVTENTTVDGVIDLAGGWFDPLAGGQDDMAAVTAEHSRAADGLLLGRRTFEAFRAFWPNQTEDPTGVADYLNRVRKYVVSTTLTEPDWENTERLGGDLVEEVSRLKAAEGRDIVATGSVQLVHALMAAGLVDEYRLFVFPIVVGAGVRLFDGADVALELLETRSFRSGVVLLRYATTGPQ
jgi:dihydrofolate reductase